MAKKKSRKASSGADQPAKPASAPAPNGEDCLTIARGLTEGLSRIGGLAGVDTLLDRLKADRHFADLAALGTTLATQSIPLSPRALRLTAQGLIEIGRFKEAKDRLDPIVERYDNPDEVLEARGLLGRIQKQVYVNQAVRRQKDAGMLRSAIEHYLTAYDNHPSRPYWHGINAAALLVRATRDRVDQLPIDRAASIASEIRDMLLKKGREALSYWELATIAEASLALGDSDQAELWFHRAAWAPSATAFALAGTIRQLREVWLLDPATSPGSGILPPLDARLLAIGRSHLIAPTTVARADAHVPLEKVFGTSPFMPFQAWAAGLECAKSVCRVEDKLNQGIGTGFIVHGKKLHKSLPDEMLLLTNAHVLSPKGDGESLTQAQAHVSFYGMTDRAGKVHTSKIKKILWSSPPDALDATIARLDKPPKPKNALSFALNLPAANSQQTVYIIGHPRGGGLTFSLNDNELLDHGDPDSPRVHYRTPTEPGSSGSPVFNGQWELIALHHAGDALMQRIHGTGTYQANEGIAFNHIAPAIRLK